MFEINYGMLIAQVINFGILYRLFKKYAAQPLLAMIEGRRSLIAKLENADQQYDDMIAKANQESKNVIAQGLQQKDNIIAEAKVLAEKTGDSVIANARKEAEKITDQAAHKAKLLQEDIASEYEKSVKATTETVVKKLINNDVDIKAAYLDTLVKEAVS